MRQWKSRSRQWRRAFVFLLVVVGVGAAAFLWEFVAAREAGLEGSLADRWADVAMATVCALAALSLGMGFSALVNADDRERQERYRSLFERGPGGIVIYDLDSLAIVDTNEKAREMFRYSTEEMLRMTPFELSADPGATSAAVQHLRQTGWGSGSWPRPMRRKDGSVFRCELFSGTTQDRKGRRQVVTVILDVSARYAVEEALRDQERRYRAVVENASDAIFVYDEEGDFLDVNRAACEGRGYSRAEMLSMNVAELVQGLSPQRLLELRANAAVKPVVLESRHWRKDGSELPVEVHSSSYLDQGGGGFSSPSPATSPSAARPRRGCACCRGRWSRT